MANAFRCIAHIQKTHGRNGEVVAVPAHGLPLALHVGLEVALVPPALKGPRWRTITSCENSPSGQLVGFSGVCNLDGSSKLVGKAVLARMEDLPADLFLHDVDALVGREVEDERLGLLGTVVEVMRGPAQDVWVVDGPYGEVLIPVVEAIVGRPDANGAYDAARTPLRVSVPRGLVDDASI